MIRVAIMSGKAYGYRVDSITSDYDGQTLAEEGTVIIYGEDVYDIEEALDMKVEMVPQG